MLDVLLLCPIPAGACIGQLNQRAASLRLRLHGDGMDTAPLGAGARWTPTSVTEMLCVTLRGHRDSPGGIIVSYSPSQG